MLVLDATPLIYLATVDRLDVLASLDEACVVPEPVYDEVVTEGLEAGTWTPDASSWPLRPRPSGTARSSVRAR